eukprot:symbB.v1.2.015435.t1/scaffold1121.1/size137196/3
MLLQDKPDLFDRPMHEVVQAANADICGVLKATATMPKTLKSLKTMEVSCVTMVKGHQHMEVVAGTCKSARERKAGAYALQQQLKRDFHSTLCNGMVCFNAHHGHTHEAEKWMKYLDTKQGDVAQVETLNALLAALIKKGDLVKAVKFDPGMV